MLPPPANSSPDVRSRMRTRPDADRPAPASCSVETTSRQEDVAVALDHLQCSIDGEHVSVQFVQSPAGPRTGLQPGNDTAAADRHQETYGCIGIVQTPPRASPSGRLQADRSTVVTTGRRHATRRVASRKAVSVSPTNSSVRSPMSSSAGDLEAAVEPRHEHLADPADEHGRRQGADALALRRRAPTLDGVRLDERRDVVAGADPPAVERLVAERLDVEHAGPAAVVVDEAHGRRHGGAAAAPAGRARRRPSPLDRRRAARRRAGRRRRRAARRGRRSSRRSSGG